MNQDEKLLEPRESGAPERSRGRFAVLLAVALGLAVLGWRSSFPSATHFDVDGDVARVLAEASSWELVSIAAELSTAPVDASADWTVAPGVFYGRPVLGRIEITDESTRRRLSRAFDRGRGRWNPPMFLCFIPRHVIRATLSPNEHVDLLICFECESYRAYDQDGNKLDEGDVSSAPRAVFNEVYRSLGLVIAPDTGR